MNQECAFNYISIQVTIIGIFSVIAIAIPTLFNFFTLKRIVRKVKVESQANGNYSISISYYVNKRYDDAIRIASLAIKQYIELGDNKMIKECQKIIDLSKKKNQG